MASHSLHETPDADKINAGPSEAAKRFHRVYDRIISRIDGYHGPSAFMDITAVCESEIEKILAAELLDLFCPINPIDNMLWRSSFHLQEAIGEFDKWLSESACYYAYGPRPRVGIFPQTRIGRWRIDFLVIGDDTASENPARSMVVIECDGHDYHERTKQQAARDRSRDRALTAANIPFLRFTGSEIWRDSHACLLEVENFLWKAMCGRDCPLRQFDEESL